MRDGRPKGDQPLPTHVGRLLHALGVTDLVPTRHRSKAGVYGVCIYDYSGERSYERADQIERVFVAARYPDPVDARERAQLLETLLSAHGFDCVVKPTLPSIVCVERDSWTLRHPLPPRDRDDLPRWEAYTLREASL